MDKDHGLKFVFLCMFFLGSCMPIRIAKSTDCVFHALIIGSDNSRCGCCGSWVIEVQGNRYLADSIPNAKEIIGNPDDQDFPIPVIINYVKSFSCNNKIVITCIKK